MILVKPSVEMIQEADPFKKIELVGRTCYKSEDLITEDSAYKFVSGLVKRSHFAMLEHARVTFEVRGIMSIPYQILNMPAVGYSRKEVKDGDLVNSVHYVTLSASHILKYEYTESDPVSGTDLFLRMCYICFLTKYTKARTESDQLPGECKYMFDENRSIKIRIIEDLKSDIVDYDESDNDIHNSYTFKFVCDRGVSHELVRHRCAVAQESTRYCNYSKAKFGGQVTFVEPANFDSWDDDAQSEFKGVMEQAEATYLRALECHNLQPQQARAFLPNALKTEVILTMPVWQWKHFFNLRSIGTTGAPHPDMKVVADIALEMFQKVEGTDK